MVLGSMYPGRQRGGQQRGGASSSSRPTGGDGDRGGEGSPTRRSRTTSRERRDETAERITALHRRIALMFVTLVEGRFTTQQPITLQGLRTTLQRLEAAARTLDTGSYVTLEQAFGFLDTPQEQRARRLLNDLLYMVERNDGRLPHEPAELSSMLLERYSEVIREAGYPLARMEEMVHGPMYGLHSPSHESEYSSYTVEQSFNMAASRSRDSTPVREARQESETTEEWTRRDGPEERDSRDGSELPQHGEGGEEEAMVEPTPEGPTPEGESVSEAGEGRFNAFENVETYGGNGEPGGEARENRSIVGRCRGGRDPPTYPALTEEELNGERYPGRGVDLSIYSGKERMCRMLECLEAQMAGCLVRVEQEQYDALRSERDDLDDLIPVASDLRPGEGDAGA